PVARVDEVLRAQQVPGGRDGSHGPEYGGCAPGRAGERLLRAPWHPASRRAGAFLAVRVRPRVNGRRSANGDLGMVLIALGIAIPPAARVALAATPVRAEADAAFAGAVRARVRADRAGARREGRRRAGA